MNLLPEPQDQSPAEPFSTARQLGQTPTVLTERLGPVFVVTINRPEVRNAVDRGTAEALRQAFGIFDADGSLAVAVLTGARATFCSGFDLKALLDPEQTGHVTPEGIGMMGVTWMLLSKPVIAAVEGYAMGGGLELALWCDLRVAADNAYFGVANRRWGVPLVDGGTIRLPRLLGHSHALDLILTGRSVSGKEAQLMELANRLVPPGEALPAAIALANELAQLPQHVLRSDRIASYEQWSLSEAAALRGRSSPWARGSVRGGHRRWGAPLC